MQEATQSENIETLSSSEQAFYWLEALIEGKVKGQKTQFFNWLFICEEKNHLDQGMNVLEHSVLQAASKFRVDNDLTAPVWAERFDTLLFESYFKLTGRRPQKSQHYKRLPKSVLKKATRDEVLFHQSLHNEMARGAWDSIKTLWMNYIPKPQDYFMVFALVVLGFWGGLGALFVGALAGYLFSSLIEFMFHLYVGHCTPKQRKFLEKLGTLGRNFAVFHIEHSVHHGSVSRNHLAQFGPEDFSHRDFSGQTEKNREAVHRSLRRRGGEKLLRSVISSNYGTGSSNEPKTYIFFSVIALFCVLLIWSASELLSLNISVWFFVGFLLLSQLWIPSSTEFHQYLHLTREQINEKASFLMAYFTKTRLSGFIARSHRVHHAFGGRINQNLNPGIDFIYGFQPIDTKLLFDLKNKNGIY